MRVWRTRVEANGAAEPGGQHTGRPNPHARRDHDTNVMVLKDLAQTPGKTTRDIHVLPWPGDCYLRGVCGTVTSACTVTSSEPGFSLSLRCLGVPDASILKT